MQKFPFFLVVFCFICANLFAKKINESIFPLYKQCNNFVQVLSESKKLDYTCENAKIVVTQIQKSKNQKGFVHELTIIPQNGGQTTIIFSKPVKVLVMHNKDVFSATKTFNLIDVPTPSFEVKNINSSLEINTLLKDKNYTFKNILPDDSNFFVEYVNVTGKDEQGNIQTIKLENKNKTANFLANLPHNFAKGQEILVKLENINRINAQKEIILTTTENKNFKVKI